MKWFHANGFDLSSINVSKHLLCIDCYGRCGLCHPNSFHLFNKRREDVVAWKGMYVTIQLLVVQIVGTKFPNFVDSYPCTPLCRAVPWEFWVILYAVNRMGIVGHLTEENIKKWTHTAQGCPLVTRISLIHRPRRNLIIHRDDTPPPSEA